MLARRAETPEPRVDEAERHGELGDVAEIAGGTSQIERLGDRGLGTLEIALVPGGGAQVVERHREATAIAEPAIDVLCFTQTFCARGELAPGARDRAQSGEAL